MKMPASLCNRKSATEPSSQPHARALPNSATAFTSPPPAGWEDWRVHCCAERSVVPSPAPPMAAAPPAPPPSMAAPMPPWLARHASRRVQRCSWPSRPPATRPVPHSVTTTACTGRSCGPSSRATRLSSSGKVGSYEHEPLAELAPDGPLNELRSYDDCLRTTRGAVPLPPTPPLDGRSPAGPQRPDWGRPPALPSGRACG
mmetsp:Transcript_26020/g.79120  ORF Transcript_26020/g.79120 Transcript_26020/m.79120 type:complete len:201 (+) Transcript_26020:1288-1890(+)